MNGATRTDNNDRCFAIHEKRTLDGHLVSFLHASNESGAFHEAVMTNGRVVTNGSFSDWFPGFYGTGIVYLKSSNQSHEKLNLSRPEVSHNTTTSL